jgi:hypothetical protein
MGTAVVGVGLWSSGHEPLTLALTLGVSAALAVVMVRSDRLPARQGVREVPMAIVPWGVVVTPDSEPRVLRWAAIRKVGVDVTHTLRGGTPAVTASLVTVHTDREVLAGRTAGSVDLERLMVDLDSYAEEAGRPVALDLEGEEPASDGATEPVAGLLMRAARELCTTSRGVCRLSLPSAGYRTVAAPVAAPETIALLRAVLRRQVDGPADARPLAAMLAAMVDARELVPDLVRLVSSPHPVVAAAAKAAALRLGAPQSRAGAVEEVEAFLFAEDVEIFGDWARAAPASSS